MKKLLKWLTELSVLKTERWFLEVAAIHANRNKKVIRRLEKGMMKVNRTRNIFAVLAVILTTFMITTVFSLGINYMENMKLSSIRTAGTAANVNLNNPTYEQKQEIYNLDYISVAGKQYMVGSVLGTTAAGREMQISIQNYDIKEWENHFKKAISNINGTYPKKENGIMLCEDSLKQLGITSPKTNMEIPLSYTDKNGKQEKIFALSGWFHSYTGVGMAFVSNSYCQTTGYTMQENGMLSLSLKNMPADFYRIQKDIMLYENQSFSGAVSMKTTSVATIAMIALLIFFIIGSGYLLIYNVLYISISKDIRFYGLIKAIGTSPSQIKTLVKRQAARFACIGIPIGVILAGGISFGLVPIFLNQGFETGKSTMDAVTYFHPSIFILSIVFSGVTVWLSCNAPAKIAAKTSPIEALRYQNFVAKKLKKRKGITGGKLCKHLYAL